MVHTTNEQTNNDECKRMRCTRRMEYRTTAHKSRAHSNNARGGQTATTAATMSSPSAQNHFLKSFQLPRPKNANRAPSLSGKSDHPLRAIFSQNISVIHSREREAFRSRDACHFYRNKTAMIQQACECHHFSCRLPLSILLPHQIPPKPPCCTRRPTMACIS